MAKQHGNPAGTKPPLSRHPLFPAIVALWFGALFGLGSLAIRTSVLETLILSGNLDALLPVVAPPLGMKARILLALTLAVIGGIAGVSLARRIARPKQERRERKRQAVRAPRSSPESRLSDPITPAPIYPQEEQARFDPEPEAPASEPFVPTSRRRSLAIEENYEPEYARDDAPLPGGAPQIFDVTAYDFGATTGLPEPDGAQADDRPLDLGAFAEAVTAIDQSASRVTDSAANPVPAASQSASGQGLPIPEEEFPAAQSPYKPTPYDMTPPEYAGVTSYSAAQASGQPSERPFAAPVEALGCETGPVAPLPRLALPTIESALFESAPQTGTTEGEAEEIRQVFANPLAIAAQAQSAPQTAPSDFAPESASRPFDAASQAVEAAAGKLPPFGAPEAAPEELLPAANAASAPETMHAPASAAGRISGDELGSLSPVELVERLARSLQRRREAAGQDLVSSAQAPAAAEVSNYQEPVAAVGASVASPFTIPLAFEAPASPELPAAMRPVVPDQFEAEDEVPNFTLPRQAAMLSPVTSDPGQGPEEEAENDSPEMGYSSLLDLARPNDVRQQFVRIEEPEPETDAIEPVVVFPGQAARERSRFAAPIQLASEINGQMHAVSEIEARRFDPAPEAPQSVAPFSRPAAVDREETERALRSALATLQRMSGAA